MTRYKLFSQRQIDAAKAGEADVYQYDYIPDKLKVQIERFFFNNKIILLFMDLEKIENTFLYEKGLRRIAGESTSHKNVIVFMRRCNTPEWLDFLELIILDIKKYNSATAYSSAIDEINYRLKKAGVGYQFENNQIMRIDSQFIHAEIVKLALTLLSDQAFNGPRDEFLKAHTHYRAGDYRQAITMAANALESTFKAIFEQKGWEFNKGDSISQLAKTANRNHLWPDYLSQNFDQLTAALKSGLPEIRNNTASHGQGAEIKQVPPYIASHALHLAACNIVFLVEAAKAIPT